MIDLFKKAQDIISARGVWEQKQRLFYQMRHEGLRRRSKPWPSAADSHFPLIDMQIRKYKPFWLSQALASDRLATFVALRDQLGAQTEASADYFDFTLKNRSDFVRKLRTVVDHMLLRGRGVMKVTVDPFDGYRLNIEAIDPVFILMPETANGFEDTDWFVHVKQLTVPRYQKDRRFDQDAGVLRQITGTKENRLSQFWQDKELREGITHSRADDVIVLWDHFVRTPGGWTNYTYSPQAPQLRLKQAVGVPYKFQGKTSLPFFSFVMEVKDEGWYSPRGLAELTAPFEVYCTKLWNEKADAMTFGNRPLFTSEKDIPNTASLKWQPGEFIPGNVQAVQMPQPAFSFDQEINFARQTAEQLTLMPDFGIVDANTAKTSGARTATENNRIAQLQSVGSNDNGLLFREDLCKVYRHIWGLLLQFHPQEMSYLAAEELKTLPDQALHDEYLILPGGATDEWDGQKRQQKAMTLLQAFKGAPNVDQDWLVQNALSAFDPRAALKAFIPSNQKAGNEAEDEAVDVLLLQQGFPAMVKPNEDHATRIHVLMGWLQKMAGAPVNPVAKQRVQEHLAVHWLYLRKLEPEAAHQLEQELNMQERAQLGPARPGPFSLNPS